MAEKLIRIVTNNPEIQGKDEIPHEITFVDGSPICVLEKAMELAQDNWLLVSTPLPPNIPIMRAPYRSLAMQKNTSKYDAQGMIALEKALVRYKQVRDSGTTNVGKEDFAVIDMTMLERALRDAALIDG